jgi:hypothetical protein
MSMPGGQSVTKSPLLSNISGTDAGMMDIGANSSKTANSALPVPPWGAIQNRDCFPIQGDHLSLNDRNVPAYGSLGGSSQTVPLCVLQNPSNLAFNSAISQQMRGLYGNLVPTDPRIETQQQHQVRSMQQEIDRHQLRLHNDLQCQAMSPVPLHDRDHHEKVRFLHPGAAISAFHNTSNDHHAAIAAYGNVVGALPPVASPTPSIKDIPEAQSTARPTAAAASSPSSEDPQHPLLTPPAQPIPPPRDHLPAAPAAPAAYAADAADAAQCVRGADGKRSRGRPRGSKDRQVLPRPADY